DRARRPDRPPRRGLSSRDRREDDLGARAAAGQRTQLEAAVEALLDHSPNELQPETRRTLEAGSAVVDAQPCPRTRAEVTEDRRRAVPRRVRDQLVGDDAELLRGSGVERGRL